MASTFRYHSESTRSLTLKIAAPDALYRILRYRHFLYLVTFLSLLNGEVVVIKGLKFPLAFPGNGILTAFFPRLSRPRPLSRHWSGVTQETGYVTMAREGACTVSGGLDEGVGRHTLSKP